MMSGHIDDRLDAYLEGMLNPAQEEAFDRHVTGCAACRKALRAAREARQCIDWLLPTEAAPVPGPEFYVRVQESIDRQLSRNWFETLAGAMRPRLVYPLLLIGLLSAAWTLTVETREPEEGLAAIEYPTVEFAHMSFTLSDRELSQDLVMTNLVDLPLGP